MAGDDTKEDPQTPCEHTFGAWETTKQATCNEEGKKVRTCSKCSQIEEESIQKSETHTMVTDAAVAATCKATGLTEGSHCSVCNKVLVAQTVTSKTEDHIRVIDAAVPATCKKTGLTEGSHCSVCNKVLVAQAVAPKTEDHTPVIDAAVPATCKDTGLTEGSHCSVCNKVLVKQESIPLSNDHKFVRSQDYMSYKCSLCGLTVIEHGNADGSWTGGNNKIKYYVTGDIVNYTKFEIVVYGTGEMPDFSKTDLPPWQDYLSQTVKVRVEQGVTSIGKYAFYCPKSKTNCKFVMSDTVKTIKTGAIHLKITNLVLGDGVESVEADAIGDVNSIYIPKSVKNLYLDCLGNETYFYEGTLEEFYQIKIYVYNRVVTIKEYLDTLDEDYISSNIYVYLKAENISDRSHYWR
ncbi:MAG: hypothetical protein IKA46_06610 [Clostridia bacterium]|nr:hypothetical protein [Clostridia bacterium]